MFGNPETTTGGRALKFYATVRMDVRRVETLKNGNDMIGSRTRVKIVKNKSGRLRLNRLNSTLCTEKAFLTKAALLTLALSLN